VPSTSSSEPPLWELRVAATAERSLGRLPEKVAAAVVEFMLGALCENPRRVGHPLQRELSGLWSARRGAYRVIYEIHDDEHVVAVVRIDHRADVYRPS
jgi:mRNA-degrading endonuclease RelE of RelBE toxin-antitoxin system